MSSFVDLTDKSFGRLTVIERVENRGKHPRYLCKCACGAEKVFYASNLVKGLSTSCGCYRKEKLKDDNKLNRKYHLVFIIVTESFYSTINFTYQK